MAASKKNPTSGNDTPNTPGVNESEIARLKVDVLRRRLKDQGVKGTAELKKPDLVKKLIKTLVSGSDSAGKGSSGKSSSAKSSATKSSSAKSSGSTSGTGKSATKSAAKRTVSAAVTKSASAKKNPTGGNDTPNTPDVNESEIARLKVDELRRRLKDRGV